MIWTIQQTVDLAHGDQAASRMNYVNPLAYPGDANAHEWRVTVKENGASVDLSNATITAYVKRVDGSTVLLDGNGSPFGVASVIFDPEVYLFQGQISAIMRATIGDSIITIASLNATILANLSGPPYVDPEGLIPSVEDLLTILPRMETATEAAETAAQEVNDIVVVSDEQPTSETNKLWFTPNVGEVEVPTMEEFNDVNKSYRYSTPLIFDEWEQGSLNYNTGVETVSTTACRTVSYYEPRENTTVSIYNPDGNVIGTRKYNAKTGEYISASTITNNSVVVLERGYKYRLVCTNTGNPESITATFSYNSIFSAEDMVGKLDTYTSVSDYVRTQNLVVNALFSKHEESGLSIQREGFSGIKLVGTLGYEAFTYFTIGSVSIAQGETYTIYVKSKNGLGNSKIYVSLESIPGVAYNFGMGVPLVFTATATNTSARVRAWVGDPNYENGYPIDDVWYVYVVPGVHSLAEFEGNRAVTEKLTVCAWNIGLYNYGRSRADYPATAQMDMMRESLVRKFLTDFYPDVICCTEFYNLDLNHDGDDSDSRSDFELIYPYYYKTNQYMVASKYPIVNASYTEYTSQDPDDSLKKGWVVFDLLLNGKTVKIVNTHATAYARNASIRANQFQQLLSNAIPATSDRVIVLGDFNTQSASELEIFSESGYTLLNGGYNGDYYTQPAINPINPYDNIIIKGIHGVGCVYNQIYEADHADDVDYYVSDHLPLVGKLIIS